MVTQNTRARDGLLRVDRSADRTSTGISAPTARRRWPPRSIRTKPGTGASGHMFPLRARDGGRAGPCRPDEAAVDLARIAGLYPAGVICES